MGSRDFRKPEKKKPRKDIKKPVVTSSIVPPTPPVEVIRKGKKVVEPEE